MNNLIFTSLAILCSAFAARTVSSQQCGEAAGGALCADYVCCSTFGWCGTGEPWCGATCQSLCWSQERSDHQCGPGVGNSPCGQDRCCSIFGWCGGGSDYCAGGNCQYRCGGNAAGLSLLPLPRNLSGSGGVGEVLSESVFDEMFGHRKDCPSQGFYSYHAFVAAAEFFPGFGTVGDVSLRKREVAAFLAQISQLTTGKWSDVEDPNGWGLCHINSTISENDYCTSSDWPCASPKTYTNRGAIQLAYNSNYGLAGQAIGEDLIKNPELLATDPIVSFKTAVWFWMTRHHNKPSCHDVLVKANSGSTRVPLSRVSVIGAIIRGALGPTVDGDVTATASSSIGYYKRYCDMLGVSYGSHDLSYWFDNSAPSSDMARIQMSVVV